MSGISDAYRAAGARIKAFRGKKKLSQSALADLIRATGCDRPSVAKLSRVEAGQPVPLDILPALKKITGIPARELRPDLAKVFREGAAA